VPKNVKNRIFGVIKVTEQEEVLASLKRIEELLTVLVKSELSEIVEKEMRNSDMERLYAITGNCSARQAAKKLDCSLGKISNIWQKWESLGLLVKDGKTYRKVL
jgi:Ethanolamine utilization protein EutJ (predicted chaperonin)